MQLDVRSALSRRTIGEEWLNAKNLWLEGRSPNDLIGTRDEFQVRDLFRSIKAAALS
jgi:hypothetical protein